MAPLKKLLLLGIDGLDPNIIEGMMGSGQLPHFEILAQKGCYSRLNTINPPQSPVVWTSIATGCEPSVHGIYDFISRDPKTYLPYLTILQKKGSRYIRPFHTKTFWEAAGEKGIKSKILRWPLTFPPKKFIGVILSGLGVPDIEGSLGLYTFYTSNADIAAQNMKGRIVKVNPSNRRITTEILGPSITSLKGKTVSSAVLSIELFDGFVRCNLNDINFHLREKEWTPWVQVKFNMGLFVKLKCICKFYLKSIAPEFELYLTPIQIAPGTITLPISSPQEYSVELKDSLGYYATLGMAEDTNALKDEVIDEESFLISTDSILQERQKMFFYELERFEEGILACVFDTTDRVQHMFWRYIDHDRHLKNNRSDHKYEDVIPRYYQMMDKLLSAVLNRLSSDTLLITCSDHGFASLKGEVHLNTWLVQNRFMAIKEGFSSCKGLFDSVDWAKTKAYAVGFNSIFFNIKGRESHGIVTSEQAPHLKEELTHELSSLTDNGINVIKQIFDTNQTTESKTSNNVPDLIVGYQKNYRSSGQTAIGGVPDTHVIAENKKKWSGDHCCEAKAVPGIFFSNKKLSSRNISVLDICKLLVSP